MSEAPTDWHALADADDIDEDDVICVHAADRLLAIFHLEDGTYHVTDNRCTHQEASLAEGYLDEETIECPRHQGVFHVPTGKAKSPPVTENLRVYPTKVENGKIWAHLAE